MEINVQSMRVGLQNDLGNSEYAESLAQNLLELDELKLDSWTNCRLKNEEWLNSITKKL